MAAQDNPADTIEALLDTLDYEKWLHQASDTAIAEKRWESVNLLVDWVISAWRQSESDRSLPELVSELILNDALEQQKDEENTDQVSLMTLHGAKGLEFPHVHIVGVEENILPHRVSLDEGDDQEERRLFYVGVTRAMRSLTLSYAKKRKRFGDIIDCEPSRFLMELPQDEVDWEIQEVASDAQVQDTGRAHLASIRALRQDR